MSNLTKRYWYAIALVLMSGCSGEMSNPNPALQPTMAQQRVAASDSSLTKGQAGSPNAVHDAAAAAIAGSTLVQAAGAPSSASNPAAEILAPAPVATKSATIRGKVSTTPPQASKHAVVYLANAPLDRVLDARIDDIKLDFHPHVSVMTAGGTMTYVNNHPFPDSCYSTNNEKFDFGYVEAHGVRKRRFPAAGNYTLLCHVHPNEVAFLVVTPSSYFAKANKQGEFAISEVPAGNYELVAWAPRMKAETRTVVVAGGDVVIDFDLKR